jgi:hypothetical protein
MYINLTNSYFSNIYSSTINQIGGIIYGEMIKEIYAFNNRAYNFTLSGGGDIFLFDNTLNLFN